MIHVLVAQSRVRARDNVGAVSRSAPKTPKPGDEQVRYTIDQLAQVTGMTVRNIRAHQSRGLLPPPVVEARTGYYGPEHVARIKLIQEMQADGFNLASIQRLLQGATGAVEEALGFKRAALAPFVEEEPEFATLEELDARLGGAVDERSRGRLYGARIAVAIDIGWHDALTA